MKVFGPVPSRRLGKSLGVNNIPYKVCSYSCNYCQVGKAVKMQIERQEFYDPRKLIKEIQQVLDTIKPQIPDYICIVPDGEPTLDINLGQLIEQLKNIPIPIAVITNASLLYLDDVKKDLLKADYVSVKVDAVNYNIWKKINKPHTKLNLEVILKGVNAFAQQFNGKLTTETMLIKGLNDNVENITACADFIKTIEPAIAYIAVPTRPPAFTGTKAANETQVNKAWQLFTERIQHVELLTGYEGNAFSSTGNVEKDVLNITAVHPMRKEAFLEMCKNNNTPPSLIDDLIQQNKIQKVHYGNHEYYLRKFSH